MVLRRALLAVSSLESPRVLVLRCAPLAVSSLVLSRVLVLRRVPLVALMTSAALMAWVPARRSTACREALVVGPLELP